MGSPVPGDACHPCYVMVCQMVFLALHGGSLLL
jgi:hypothetical protein